MNGLHQRQVPLAGAAGAGVHQRQVIDWHVPVLLVVGVGAVSVAVVLVSARVGFVPVVGGDRDDQQKQGQRAESQAHRGHRHSRWPGSLHSRDMERTAGGPGEGPGSAVLPFSTVVFVTAHFVLPSSRRSADVRICSRARCHADYRYVKPACNATEVLQVPFRIKVILLNRVTSQRLIYEDSLR